MIQQRILKPVSVFKRKINAVDSNRGSDPTEASMDVVTAKAAEAKEEAEEEDATEDVLVEVVAEEEEDHTTLKLI